MCTIVALRDLIPSAGMVEEETGPHDQPRSNSSSPIRVCRHTQLGVFF